MWQYSGGGRSSSNGSIFVGGFVLGGIVVGALACVFAPQVFTLTLTHMVSLNKQGISGINCNDVSDKQGNCRN